MIKYLVAALCLLVPVAALAQGSKQSGADLPRFTVGTLPTTCTADRDLVLVTDADSAGNCALGSGTALAICGCNSTGTGFESTSGTSTSGTLPVTDDVSMAEGDVDDTREVRFEVDTLLDGSAGVTTGNVRVLHVPDEDIDLHDSQTDHEERYGLYRPEDYGAIVDDAVDDTVAFIAAFDACEAGASSGGNRGTLKLSAGTYRLSDQEADGIAIDFSTGVVGFCNMEGVHPRNTQSAIEWTGTDGVGTVFKWDMGAFGEFTTFQGIQFRDNVNVPRYWLDIKGMDRFSSFTHLKFQGKQAVTTGAETTGIKLTDWVNASFEWIRCDDITWCFEPTYGASIDGSHFNLSDFTIDNSNVDGLNDGPHGFLYSHCELGTSNECGPRNVGVFHISDGRIEAFATEDFHAFAHDSSGGGEIRLDIDNVTMRQNAGTPPNCSISNDPFGNGGAPAASARMTATVFNSQLGGDKLCNWGADYEEASFNLEQASPNWMVGHRNAWLIMSGTTQDSIKISQSANGKAIGIYNRDDLEGKVLTDELAALALQGDGDILFSSDPGTGDLDIQIGPTGAGELGMPAGDSFCFNAGTECIRYNSVKACLYYDENDNDKCENGEELSANCATACDGVE